MPARRAGAAAVSVAAALAAVAVCGSGFDRLGRSDRQAAALVPETFRSQSWHVTAEEALAQRRISQAITAAEAAVGADPADPAGLSLLGLARLTAGDDAGAAAAFRISGSLGWRDLPTQLYWLSIAAAIGDHPVAAERADAILRQNSALLEQPRFLAELEAAPAGRRALAARLASRPPWFAEYWSRTFALPPERLVQRAAVLDAEGLRHAKIGCEEVRGLAARLSENGKAPEGRVILERFCAGGDRDLLADGGFERARLDAASPGGWQFAGLGGLSLRLTGASGRTGREVKVASTLPYRVVFATQSLQLAPGPYRISWRARYPRVALAPHRGAAELP